MIFHLHEERERVIYKEREREFVNIRGWLKGMTVRTIYINNIYIYIIRCEEMALYQKIQPHRNRSSFSDVISDVNQRGLYDVILLYSVKHIQPTYTYIIKTCFIICNNYYNILIPC